VGQYVNINFRLMICVGAVGWKWSQ